jgi:hypothetical protein
MKRVRNEEKVCHEERTHTLYRIARTNSLVLLLLDAKAQGEYCIDWAIPAGPFFGSTVVLVSVHRRRLLMGSTTTMVVLVVAMVEILTTSW